MKYLILPVLFLLGCSHAEKECGYNYYSINYEVMNTNQDKKISRSEFDGYLDQIFGVLDKNKNGHIEDHEWGKPKICE